MITSISSAMSAIRGMTELLKSANDLKSTAEINTIKIEMQRLIIELQNSLMQAQLDSQEMINELSEYKRKIQLLDDFQLKAKNYRQIKLVSGSIIYRDEENNIDICPHCFGNKNIALLQPTANMNGYNMLKCQNCRNKIQYEKAPGINPNILRHII